ncbi:MAG: RdgB/HAM1 family non-canonical purine NTP pyrophosphatase [Anaerolineales bacterium]|jgi:XTP/dITP diphosphohydrolase|nr:RdgB/HAM1 family non-canonical purine NTP pyrophosphatase [Anaerolineales bacterium]
MPKLLIATENQGKIRELQELLAGLGLELVTPRQIGLNLAVVEDGETYQENAAKKARAYAAASGLIALADDSGLEVDHLGGAPGLYSARYSPKPGATDADRRAYLLENLRGKARPWAAHFHASLALALPAGGLYFAEGDCYGEISPEERGTGGFGYDPVFVLASTDRTMAELGRTEKNRLSHRALAVQNAIPILKKVFGG